MERIFGRRLRLEELLAKKSLFLFGPRQTGKTSLIRATLEPDIFISLLESDAFLRLSASPWLLRELVAKSGASVVIDEIQKIPALLDEVHWLIEERKARFLLTGSSPRKLRRAGVNLLGGRARTKIMHPLVSAEIGDVDLLRALAFGTLPSIYLSDAPQDDLRSYVTDYVREEVAAEGLVRNVPAFSRFLEVAALCNTQMLNYTNVANDAQVARTTVHEYFSILRDTLLGYDLPAWGAARKRKPIETSKFYFFDGGVARALQGRFDLTARSAEFGEALEAFVFHELRALVDYTGQGALHYWRTTSGFEVDFILNESVGIEVKATRNVSAKDLKGLRALREETPMKRLVCVCMEKQIRHHDGIEIVPIKEFLTSLWSS